MIRILFTDVDGSLTDGKIIIASDGTETKNFSVKDGIGIIKAKKLGMIIAIITGRSSKCVTIRASELQIDEVRQGVSDKVAEMDKILEKYGLSYNEAAFFGDDINDIPSMQKCQVSGSPSDAEKEVLDVVSYISSRKGGEGAARDFIEHLIELNNSDSV